MDDSVNIMSFLKDAMWPIAAIIISISAVVIALIFRTPLLTLIPRIRKINRNGIEIDKPENQRIEASTLSITYEDLIRIPQSNSARKLEDDIKTGLETLNLKDEETIKILTVGVATTRVEWLFERIFQSCWKSQYDILETLNAHIPEGLDNTYIKAVFDLQKISYPEAYKNREVEEYVSYLINTNLLINESGQYKITDLGRDYLIYLAQTGSRKALWPY